MVNIADNERQWRYRAKKKELSGPSTSCRISTTDPRPGEVVLLAALTEGSMSRPAWQSQAACRGCTPELFFTDQGEPTTNAKAVCRKCPVQAECLEYGLNERFGVWGGKSERERRWLRTQRKRERQSA